MGVRFETFSIGIYEHMELWVARLMKTDIDSEILGSIPSEC